MKTIGRKQALKGQAGYAALVVASGPALNQRDAVIPRLLVGEIRSGNPPPLLAVAKSETMLPVQVSALA